VFYLELLATLGMYHEFAVSYTFLLFFCLEIIMPSGLNIYIAISFLCLIHCRNPHFGYFFFR
uniref:Uncharacterized protein n=1 Tax=Aegilops tauschii subsp. strangulata TaxID=200361 RepID=A0A453MBL6_AEGTS